MGCAEAAPSKGALIAQAAFEYDEQTFAPVGQESPDEGEIAFGRGLTLLAIAVAALGFGLLPAVTSLAIVLGWTVPLAFGAGAGLAMVAGFKVCAGAWGMVAASRAPRPAVPISFIAP
jgi:hypothetical protein